jgi:hypothetical protein
MSQAADRQRQCRARRRKGEVLYRLALPHDAMVKALIANERLTEGEALRRRLVEQALTTVLVDWSRRWKSSVTT